MVKIEFRQVLKQLRYVSLKKQLLGLLITFCGRITERNKGCSKILLTPGRHQPLGQLAFIPDIACFRPECSMGTPIGENLDREKYTYGAVLQ
jgi:hypothetical protein